jgi:hypothetical protein
LARQFRYTRKQSGSVQGNISQLGKIHKNRLNPSNKDCRGVGILMFKAISGFS